MVRKRRDLRKVRHHENLPAHAERLEAQADLDCGFPTDAGIHLIENKGGHAAGARAGGLDREHDASELARMMSGGVTAKALSRAHELLEEARR